MGVKHVLNGNGTVTQFDADSGRELVTFPDTDGSFTRDHVEPAGAAESQPAPTSGSNGDALWARARALAPSVDVRPDNETVTPEAPASSYTTSLTPPVMPSKAAPESPGLPATSLPVAGTETTGLAAPDRALHAERREGVTAASEQANASQTAAEQQQLAARANRVQTESDRSLGRYASDLELHELAKKKTLEAEDYVKQQRAVAPDPGQALAGPKFFYAIMAGVGASLSNFGAALLHQQGTQDTNLVDDIVAASVKQQMADRALKVEGAQDSLDARRKEELQLGITANASLEKWFQAQAQVEQSPEVRAAWASHADERRAAIALQSAQLAEKEYNTEVQKRAVPKPVKGAKTPTEVQAIMAKHGVDQKLMSDYTKQRTKTGADIVLGSVDKSIDVVNKLSQGQDVPGLGTWDKFTTAWANDPDGAAVQQTLGMTKAQFIKSISGAAVTEPEAKRLEGLVLGPGWRPTQETVLRGLHLIKGVAEAQLETLNSGYSDAADAYSEIHGVRGGRVKLTSEQQANRDHQLKGPAKPAARTEPSSPAAPAEATPENVAEFAGLPSNNPAGGYSSPAPKRKRTSREDDLRSLLED